MKAKSSPPSNGSSRKTQPVDERSLVTRVCAAWDTGASDPWVAGEPVTCRSVVVVPSGDGEHSRVAYLGVGSPVEQVLGAGTQLRDRSGSALSVTELAYRLMDGEVAALLGPGHPSDARIETLSVDALPAALQAQRQVIRKANVYARFLLRQIGLEEVSSHRGAPADLYHEVARTWSRDLALCTDPAMLMSLGADRQRYVDAHYVERASDRLPRALVRLHGLGVRSYPRLVIV